MECPECNAELVYDDGQPSITDEPALPDGWYCPKCGCTFEPTLIRKLEVLEEIANDQERDAAEFDGKPFDGRTVTEYFGNQGAAIYTLAKILQEVIKKR